MILCTLETFPALAFAADFPPVAPKFHQRTPRVRLRNLGTTDKKSSRKIKYKKGSESTWFKKERNKKEKNHGRQQKMVEAITSMDTDFAQWYTDVVKKQSCAIMQA